MSTLLFSFSNKIRKTECYKLSCQKKTLWFYYVYVQKYSRKIENPFTVSYNLNFHEISTDKIPTESLKKKHAKEVYIVNNIELN